MKELKLLLDMYKSLNKDQRDKVQLMAAEKKLRAEVEELKLQLKKVQVWIHYFPLRTVPTWKFLFYGVTEPLLWTPQMYPTGKYKKSVGKRRISWLKNLRTWFDTSTTELFKAAAKVMISNIL
jgi:hypothetical protein